MHIVYLYHKRLLNYTIKTKKDYVADHLYISRQFISKWENGNSYPDLDNLVKLSTYYEVSIDELLKENQELKKKIEENEVKIEENVQKLDFIRGNTNKDEGLILLILAFIGSLIPPLSLILALLLLRETKKQTHSTNLFI